MRSQHLSALTFDLHDGWSSGPGHVAAIIHAEGGRSCVLNDTAREQQIIVSFELDAAKKRFINREESPSNQQRKNIKSGNHFTRPIVVCD
jgi:hypothetical protein